MKTVLIVGPIDASALAMVRQLSRRADLHLTLYTPSQVLVPDTVTALTEETLDEGGLSAAMVGQDVVVALVPTIALVATTRLVVTAATAVQAPQVIVSRTDDMDGLVGDQRTARQLLADADLAYDLIEGLAGIGTLLGANPAPLSIVPLADPSKKTG